MKLRYLLAVVLNVCAILGLGEANLENCQSSDPIVSRIFGGEKVTKFKIEFPWLVALYNRKNEKFFCAGSLISEKHVLSGTRIAV